MIEQLIEQVSIAAFLEGAMVALKRDDPYNQNDRPQFVEAIKLALKHHDSQEHRFHILNLVKRLNIKEICCKCGGNIQEGQALDNTWVGSDDFGGDAGQPGTTMSKIGTPVLVKCMKCKSCGHSYRPI